MSSNTNSKKSSNNGKITSSSKAAKQSKVFADLQKELELTGRVRNESGQLVKRHPRHMRPELTKKRKAREKEDQDEMAMEVDESSDGERKRLRGSKVAFGDVVLNSMPLSTGGGTSSTKKGDEIRDAKTSDSDEEEEENILDDENVLENVATLGIDIESDLVEVEENDDSDDDNEEGDHETGGQCNEAKTSPTDLDYLGPHMRKNTPRARHPKPKKVYKKRLIYRLRDFTSRKLSLRHSEALGAHVRGDSETAIQKLREVAKAAPGAPQVYSSLGMVYEGMLEELEKGLQSTNGKMQMSFQFRRLEVAQKAYASLHIASVLCRKDFVLWERSGDLAMKMVQIYDEIIDNGNGHVTDKDSEFPAIVGDPTKWRTERTQSLDHALNAYLSADNLRPPGVDVACKLARVNMKLGKLIDALTILTDLRNGGGHGIEGSYPCWLLYADLMMKIGFECTRWNSGTCTNQDYMLKRWLRKHSKTFDWKERRLQALCLALEAAVGSKAAAGMKQRMKERTKQLFVNEQIEKEADQDQNVESEASTEAQPNATTLDSGRKTPGTQGDDEQQSTEATNSLGAAKSTTYEEERSNLAKRNEMEMQKFDIKTKSMNPLEGSHIYKARMSARAALVEKHRHSVRELARHRFSHAMQESTPPEESHTTPDEIAIDLPLQASCSTVCEIAALLLTQCVQMALKNRQSCRDLYRDGLSVAQSVLSYYTERIARHAQRIEKQERHRTKLESKQGLQPVFDHDDDSDEERDTDVSDVYISDDDDLNQPEYLNILRKGFLPVNIRALYSLCLVGAGGQDFLALSYIEKVMSSDELNLLEIGAENEFNDDAPWILFEKQFNMAIDKTSFLALVADMTKAKASRKTRMSVARMLRSHIKKVDAEHGLDELIASGNELLRTNILKILFGGTKLMLESAEMEYESLTESDKSDPEDIRRVVSYGLSALDNIIRFQHILWAPTCSSDWSLSSTSLEIVEILSAAMSLLSHALYTLQDKCCKDIIKSTLLKCRSVIAMISNTANDSLEGVYDSLKAGYDEDCDKWTAFPLPCTWETVFQKNISRLAYNLCVGNCVSSFSGWTPEEFNIDSLHHNREDVNIFGISLDGASVAGFLSKDAAASVSRQWDSVRQILPNLEPLRYDSLLSQRMDSEWYQRVSRHSSKIKSIPSFKEDDALMALLSFSAVCLFATKHSDLGEKDELVKSAMSVLLPVTQFSVDKDVWQSRIGTKAISEMNGTSIGYYVDENSQWMGPTKNSKAVLQYKTTPSEQPKKAPSRTRITPRFRHHSNNKHSVQVPTAIMLSEWNRDELPTVDMDPPEGARRAMTTLDNSMKNLRKSRTLQALERSSLDVAAALIEVASHQECHNPFLCLQQAAIFAAMGPKQGNNDEPLKKFLPLQKKCTEQNALVILGRADCLRAIHFLDSAQFLCSWVANICRIHRDGEHELTWSSRWSVISALLACVSDNVNDTAEDLGKQLSEWDEEVKEVLAQGKNAANLLLNSRQLTHVESEQHGEADEEVDYSGYNDKKNLAEYDINAAELTGETHGDKNYYPGFDSNINMTETHLLHDATDEPEQDDNLFGGMNWASV